MENMLSQSLYASDHHELLENIESQLTTLNYSPQEHRHITSEIQRLLPYYLEHQKLVEALTRLPQEEEELDRSKERLAQLNRELTHSRDLVTRLDQEKNDLSRMDIELKKARDQEDSFQERAQSLLSHRGDIEGRLQRIKDLKVQQLERTRNLVSLREEQGIYLELSQAFSRQGIQSLLIETIRPLIEQEANELLGRMTDGRMSVKLETQKELRSRRGEYAETLDIRISDELGSRSYEMFSGGEAFRINLALRIALSKILAHRSGAPLPTLFIDEGFGTQDGAGRERIVDVIQAIAPDFQRIIVITHLEELKEAFPVRIEVEKIDGASTCRIN